MPNTMLRRCCAMLTLVGVALASPDAMAGDTGGCVPVSRVLNAAGPSPRHSAEIVFDARRGASVLLGGQNHNGLIRDLWEFDGESWRELALPVGFPTNWQYGSFIYNPVRQRVSFFEGTRGRFWEFDGTTWQTFDSRLRTYGGPMHYFDTVRGVVRAFDTYGEVSEARFVPGSNGRPGEYEWTQILRREGATTGVFHYDSELAFAFDPERGELVVFGGRPTGGSDVTKVFDGATWIQREPMHRPPRLYGAVAAWDPVSRRVLLTGGFGLLQVGPFYFQEGVSAETLAWDGTDWAKLSAATPGGRYRAAMCFDVAASSMLLFGGIGASLQGDTLALLPGGWSRLLEPMRPRRGHVFVRDTTRNESLVFGGADTEGNVLGDTWVFSGGAWGLRGGSLGGPVARVNAAAVFDAARGSVLMYGGTNGSNVLTDGWLWNSASWAQVGSPGAGTPSVKNPSMVFDSARGAALLHGDSLAVPGLAETWAWTGATWLRASVDGPLASGGAVPMAFDAARGSVIAVANGSSAWAWDGVVWRTIPDVSLNVRGTLFADPSGDGVWWLLTDTLISSASAQRWDGSRWRAMGFAGDTSSWEASIRNDGSGGFVSSAGLLYMRSGPVFLATCNQHTAWTPRPIGEAADAPVHVIGVVGSTVTVRVRLARVLPGAVIEWVDLPGVVAAMADADGDAVVQRDVVVTPQPLNVVKLFSVRVGSPECGWEVFEAGSYSVGTCPGDRYADGVIDSRDLVGFLAAFGVAGGDGFFDFNADGVVNSVDLVRFLGLFGRACGG